MVLALAGLALMCFSILLGIANASNTRDNERFAKNFATQREAIMSDNERRTGHKYEERLPWIPRFIEGYAPAKSRAVGFVVVLSFAGGIIAFLLSIVLSFVARISMREKSSALGDTRRAE